MTTYVALLRAVNVGAANRIRMDPLRKAFVANGFDDAVTHIQSGNVIFTSSATASAVKASVEGLMAKDLGMKIQAIIRTPKQLAAVVKANPFRSNTDKIATLYVSFLDEKPDKASVASLEAMTFGGDEFVVSGSELFLRYKNGAGTSKLNNAVIERKLGVAATARNWAVTIKLAELSAAHGR